jgi:hypothetical protein
MRCKVLLVIMMCGGHPAPAHEVSNLSRVVDALVVSCSVLLCALKWLEPLVFRGVGCGIVSALSCCLAAHVLAVARLPGQGL